MTTERNIIIHAGQTFELSLDYAGTVGRGQRMHIRASDAADDVIAILTHNGADNARVIYNDATQQIDIRIGASVSGAWLVGANRVEWKYDIEDYDLSDDDDIDIPFRGASIVYGNRTRPEDVTPSAALPSGDGRYVRFDGVQGLTDAQKLQARENIGAGTGGSGSGDVVGPASATDDRIAAFDGTTGKLIKQGSVTATAVASHLSSTSNPHSVTAAQVGADPAGTAASAVSTHAGAADPHGDRAYADGLAANYATAAQGALADSAVQDIAAEINAATASSIADADEVGFWQSVGSALRKITWSNIKATLKTYFDTLYQAALVSGTNIKTVNSNSLLGSGDIAISASPGGSDTQVQFNDGGALAGDSGFTFNKTNNTVDLGGATVTASDPVLDLSQTWNSSGVTFTGWKLNITNTASAADSLFADMQSSGVSRYAVTKEGHQRFNNGTSLSSAYLRCVDYFGSPAIGLTKANNDTSFVFHVDTFATVGYVRVGSTAAYAWASTGTFGTNPTMDLLLFRDAAGTLAQRNGTNAQTFRVYRSYTDASNYSRWTVKWNTSTAILHAEGAGTGADGSVAFNDAALATDATRGFLMIPSCAGTPTGTPADIPTGQAPIVYDSTNKKLCVWDGAAWVQTAALT